LFVLFVLVFVLGHCENKIIKNKSVNK